jgi:hypothetical protein
MPGAYDCWYEAAFVAPLMDGVADDAPTTVRLVDAVAGLCELSPL